VKCTFSAFSNENFKEAIIAFAFSNEFINILDSNFSGYLSMIGGAVGFTHVSESEILFDVSLRVSNSIFSNNSAIQMGGALYQKGNISLPIENSIFLKKRQN
jgi:predicted outer membrane repeat protein